jgi:DinB superfamily
MVAQGFFLEQFDTVRELVRESCLKGLTDEQLRYQPKEGLNSIAWLMWHTARCQDFANTLISPGREQVLNEDWLARLNVSRRDIGTGMTRAECAEFNQAVDIGALQAYCDAVAEAVREVARAIPAEDLRKPVDSGRLHQMLEDGTIANERAAWLHSFLDGKSRGWFLSMAVWHMA